MRTTLLAVCGMSPAIITETIWALASQKPQVIPNEVILITTTIGAVKIEEQLFTPRPSWNNQTVWESLRTTLQAENDQLILSTPKVITLPDRRTMLEDIRTPAENVAAAEFLFSEVSAIVSDSGRHLIASIAGGRKTMSALLHSAISVLGRETDRITHVLVSSPYDTISGFFIRASPIP